MPGCQDVRGCALRSECQYARIFEPGAIEAGPSGLADWPRPFVFRGAHLDGCTVPPGAGFHFDLHLFELRNPPLEFFRLAFAQLAHDGLGPGRGRATLISLDHLEASVDLTPASGPSRSIRVRFVTPTELKAQHQLAPEPEFAILFSRIRDRLSTLSALYGPGALPIDFQGLGERAACIRMTRCDLRRAHRMRRSTRTGQVHSIGGFVGEAEYAGELTEFVPYLQAAVFTGVGRHTTWGNGEIELTSVPV